MSKPERNIISMEDLLRKSKLEQHIFYIGLSNMRKNLYFLFSVVFGAAKIEADLKLRFDITEPINPNQQYITQEEFRNFTIEQVKQIIENFLK